MDEIVKKLNPKMKKFVDNSLDLIHLNQFYENYLSRGGVLDGYQFHIHLVQWFLSLEIEFDRQKYPQYQNIKNVRDLPDKDIKECLFYLNYSLGTTHHTGGHDYMVIYDKIKKSLSS